MVLFFLRRFYKVLYGTRKEVQENEATKQGKACITIRLAIDGVYMVFPFSFSAERSESMNGETVLILVLIAGAAAVGFAIGYSF